MLFNFVRLEIQQYVLAEQTAQFEDLFIFFVTFLYIESSIIFVSNGIMCPCRSMFVCLTGNTNT